MLGGVDPILIFNFSKNSDIVKDLLGKKIPVATQVLEKINLPAIPLYLSEEATGLYIDTEDKSIEIDTSTETLQTGDPPIINQRGLNNTVKISLIGKKGSIGLTLISALADVAFPLVTAKEVSITYLHGAITVFAGLLHSFNVNQNSNNELHQVTIELIRIGIQQQQPITKIDAKPNVILNAAKVPGAA